MTKLLKIKIAGLSIIALLIANLIFCPREKYGRLSGFNS